MRRSVLAVVLVAVAALVASLGVSPTLAAPSAVQPLAIGYSGTDTGSFYVAPDEFFEGEKVKLTANFPNDNALDDIGFYRETAPGSGDYEKFDTDKANSSGNAYIYDYEVQEKQNAFARTPSGDVTELHSIEPKVVEPGACTTAGMLYVSPTVVTAGQKVRFTANFPSDQAGTTVTFLKKVGTDSESIGSDDANSSGNAYLDHVIGNSAEEIYALSSKGRCTAPITVTPTVILPENFPDNASLYPPTSVYDGRKGSITANFPSGTVGITLFKETAPGVWTAVGQKTSNKSGNATFTDYKFDGTQTLFALSSKGERTEVQTVVPKAPNEVTGGPSTLGKNVVYVTTNSGGTPVTKGVDYPAKTVIKSGDTLSATLDLETIAVRGNSSADKDKKPYKLKFENKQKPFGMKSDKTWIMLANYGDWTLIRSMVAWDLGKMLDGLKWTPDSRFAELFLNGKYMGSYQMVQSIKIDGSRVDIDDTTGQVIEFDPHWKEDGVPGMVGKSGMNYAWKDPDEFKELDGGGEDPEGLTNAKISAMKTRIRAFETVLYGADGTKDWSKVHYSTLAPQDDWMTYLDLDSAVDYYLAREFTKDNDADFYRSNFFYTNDVDPNAVDPTDPNDPDKFFMGPIWDFDRSAGAKPAGDTSVTSPTGWWIRGNGSPNHDTNKIHWFTRIAKDPRFLKALHDRWAAKKAAFEAIGPSGVTAAVAKMSGIGDYELGKQVAANDRSRWAGHGGRYPAKTSSYTGELNWVRDWYSDRYAWMNTELLKNPPPIPD